MKTTHALSIGALLLCGGAQALDGIVLPAQTGGFHHRGTVTDAQVFTIALPDADLYNEYDSELGLVTGVARLEVPINVPQFDDSLGELIAINITMNAFLESEIGVEANGILNANIPHEAGFNTIETLFGGLAGYPVVGLLQRPSADPRGIAPNFYPIGPIGSSCFGFPGDEHACIEFDVFDTTSGTTVDVFVFEDENGPIYTLSDWIGPGFVPDFTLFLDNPNNTHLEDQFEFYVDNVDSASGFVHTFAYDGTLTVEYVYEIDQPDSDGDGVIDLLDNCTLHQNPAQVDSNGDGFGNACDPDLNDDGIVNAPDLGIFRTAFFSTGVTDTDFNADGITNAVDLGVLKEFFFGAPGPSGVVP